MLQRDSRSNRAPLHVSWSPATYPTAHQPAAPVSRQQWWLRFVDSREPDVALVCPSGDALVSSPPLRNRAASCGQLLSLRRACPRANIDGPRCCPRAASNEPCHRAAEVSLPPAGLPCPRAAEQYPRADEPGGRQVSFSSAGLPCPRPAEQCPRADEPGGRQEVSFSPAGLPCPRAAEQCPRADGPSGRQEASVRARSSNGINKRSRDCSACASASSSSPRQQRTVNEAQRFPPRAPFVKSPRGPRSNSNSTPKGIQQRRADVSPRQSIFDSAPKVFQRRADVSPRSKHRAVTRGSSMPSNRKIIRVALAHCLAGASERDPAMDAYDKSFSTVSRFVILFKKGMVVKHFRALYGYRNNQWECLIRMYAAPKRLCDGQVVKSFRFNSCGKDFVELPIKVEPLSTADAVLID